MTAIEQLQLATQEIAFDALDGAELGFDSDSDSRPSLDHSTLSPNGNVSKRAREAAMRRETAKLFPAGYWDKPEPTEGEQRAQKAASLRRTAQNLREMAQRGMSPRKNVKAAERMEAEAEGLEAA